MEDGALRIRDLIGFDPDVKKAFADETEDTFVIVAVRGDIKTFFQLEQKIEEPCAVGIQKVAFFPLMLSPVLSPG